MCLLHIIKLANVRLIIIVRILRTRQVSGDRSDGNLKCVCSAEQSWCCCSPSRLGLPNTLALEGNFFKIGSGFQPLSIRMPKALQNWFPLVFIRSFNCIW